MSDAEETTPHLTETLVDTTRVSERSDIEGFADSLSVGMHNKWIDLRSKELGAFDYDDVRLVVEWRFEEVDDDE